MPSLELTPDELNELKKPLEKTKKILTKILTFSEKPSAEQFIQHLKERFPNIYNNLLTERKNKQSGESFEEFIKDKLYIVTQNSKNTTNKKPLYLTLLPTGEMEIIEADAVFNDPSFMSKYPNFKPIGRGLYIGE